MNSLGMDEYWVVVRMSVEVDIIVLGVIVQFGCSNEVGGCFDVKWLEFSLFEFQVMVNVFLEVFVEVFIDDLFDDQVKDYVVDVVVCFFGVWCIYERCMVNLVDYVSMV